jgi:mitogen-activated protein kinase kinase kinase
MVRVSNYFDTQVRVPGGETEKHKEKDPDHEKDKAKDKNPIHRSKRRAVNGAPQHNGTTKSAFEDQLEGNSAQAMTDEQKASWYSKILDSVRLRYRKLLRFARYDILSSECG